MLLCYLRLHKSGKRSFWGCQLGFQMGNGILDFLDFGFQPVKKAGLKSVNWFLVPTLTNSVKSNKNSPAIGVIIAGLDIRSHCAALKTTLSDFERRLFVIDCLLEELNIFIHVENFLHDLEFRANKFWQFLCGLRLWHWKNLNPFSHLFLQFREAHWTVFKREDVRPILSWLLFILLTFCRCACNLFLASVVSEILALKATLTVLNWDHISLAHARSVDSMSWRSLSLAARSLWGKSVLM